MSQALLLDSRRLYLRAVAHAARHAAKYVGTPSLDVWLAEHIRKSLKELIAEDEQALRESSPAQIPEDPWLRGLSELLGVESALVKRGCASFNTAEYEVRSAFFSVVIDGKPLAVWSAANGLSEQQVRAYLKRALWLLGLRDEFDLEGFLEGRADEP